MLKKNLLRSGLVLLSAVILLASCRKKDVAALPDNLVNFETNAQGIPASETSIVIKLKLLRSTDRDIAVAVGVTPTNLTYGTDYTTTPAATNNVINVTIPSGNNEASITVSKVAGVGYIGDEKLVLDITSSATPVFIGATKQFTLNFSELLSENATATINGGGATYPNKVFIDLSANRQTAVPRASWDLGFYTGADDFRVILNSSTAMMAKQIDKNDLTQVTAADTLGFGATVFFNGTNPTLESLPYIDYPNGDLSRTAIAAISATAADNKVYIVNRGLAPGSPAPARGWKKVRIIRNAGGGYTLQHADIAATTFQEITVAKNDAYFFNYISFENGAVPVEPQKAKWDLAWTYFSNVTNFGSGEVPYLFQDIILQNRNVAVAKVMVATKPFDAFAEADLAGLTYGTAQATIGADWRSGGGPGVSPSVRTDRYYIVKDGDGNYYKVKFTALTENGERGYPAYQSVLVKQG